ncbi:MAG TPA: hypothetical protein VGM67_00105 [Gemmatimonadaceae bacterium]
MNLSSRTIGALAVLGAIGAAACHKDVPRDTPPTDSAVTTSASSAAADSAARAPGSKSYVGLSYKNLPAGVTSTGGATLSNPGDVRGNYAFTQVATPRGDMIWLDTVTAAQRIVLAELPLPPMAHDERLMIGSCDVSGKLDPRAIAIVINDSGATRFTKIRQAWRVDLHAARFDLIPVAGVVCEDPGS